MISCDDYKLWRMEIYRKNILSLTFPGSKDVLLRSLKVVEDQVSPACSWLITTRIITKMKHVESIKYLKIKCYQDYCEGTSINERLVWKRMLNNKNNNWCNWKSFFLFLYLICTFIKKSWAVSSSYPLKHCFFFCTLKCFMKEAEGKKI